MYKTFVFALIGLVSTSLMAQDPKLSGTVIGTELCVDYDQSGYPATTTVNTAKNAFDGNLDTYFATYERSYTWCGLDLGTPHIISRVGWSPRNDGDNGRKRVQLAVFEGANSPDFMDAIPFYIVPQTGTIGVIDYADINCSRAFRYVRYVGPADARCNVAEVEFYGHEGVGDDSHLPSLTNIPTVVIHTQDNVHPVDKVTDIIATIHIIDNNGNHILSAPGSTRLRGNASMGFPKKPYRIKFDKKQQPLDAPAKAKKWTLINSYGDKTLLRNLLAFELSRQMGLRYTPFGTPVDVVFNGEYKGCYQLCDQIEVNPGRVDLPEEDGSMFIEVDAYANQEAPIAWFNSNYGNPVTIKYPDEETMTQEQHDAVKNFFDNMERNKRKYLDYDSFLKHFLVGEISGNTDTYWSTYMYKYAGIDTMYVGPVWDFDLAFENDSRTYPINNKSDYVYRSGGSSAGNMRSFVNEIVINDAAAKQQLTNIYSYVRDRQFTPENMTAFIQDLATTLNESQRLNFLRWPIMNQQVHMNPRTYGSYEAEVQNVINYLTKRIEWMDKKLNYEPHPVTENLSSTRDKQEINKRYYNGQLLIQRGGSTYDLLGRELH